MGPPGAVARDRLVADTTAGRRGRKRGCDRAVDFVRVIGTWHCDSAAGAPADAKAITWLVPRRDNRRDRDVAMGSSAP